jgi:PAS domain-containing protein
MDPTSPSALHFLKPVTDNLTDGVIISDKSGRFLVFNRAAQKILGRGTPNVHPQTWSEVYGCYHSDKTTPYMPDHLPLARALRGEEVSEETLCIKNPEMPQGVLIRVSGQPLKSDNGMVPPRVVS